MKNTFLQAVSHDLRTPLAAILGLAITLERGDVHLEEDDAKDLARRIAGQRPAAGPSRHEPARPRPARARHRDAEPAADRRRLDRSSRAGRVGSDPRHAAAHRHPSGDGAAPTPPRSSGSSRTCSRTRSGTRRSTSTIWVSVSATEEGALLRGGGRRTGRRARAPRHDLRAVPAGPGRAPAFAGRRASGSRSSGGSPSCTGAARGWRIATAAARRSACCCRSTRRIRDGGRSARCRGSTRLRRCARGLPTPATTGWSAATAPDLRGATRRADPRHARRRRTPR